MPESIKIMRLGSSSRIAASLIARSEKTLIEKCKTAEELENVYDSMVSIYYITFFMQYFK